MSDSISREEVLDEINRIGVRAFADYASYSNFFDFISDLPTTEERPQGERWIPVSERLPDKNGRYLVTEKYFAFDDKKHNGYSRLYVDKIEFSGGSFHRASYIEVIAWMPLPEPYKEVENDT